MQVPFVVKHIAIINYSSLPAKEIAFHVEAARQHLALLCRAWDIPVPGIQLYSDGVELPSSEAVICGAVDSDGQPGTAGYHAVAGGAPVFVYEAGLGAWVMLHELEFLVNPLLDLFDQDANGRYVWREVGDGLQDEYYPVDVELFGERREVLAPNFSWPAWHGLPNPDGSSKLDQMGTRSRPFEIAPRGYATVKDSLEGVPVQIGAARPAKGLTTSRTQALAVLVAARPPQSSR